jgi:nucleotide-binding universal stress UspA family protein
MFNKTIQEPIEMKRILIPVDGSERSLQAVRSVVHEGLTAGPVEIHLLNVQPRIFPEDALVFMPADRIDTYYYQQSGKALQPGEELVRAAGLGCFVHRAFGPIAETIVEKAGELGCEAIVMSSRGHGRIEGILMGSVSAKVLHLADVPVTLISDKTRKLDFTGRLQAT